MDFTTSLDILNPNFLLWNCCISKEHTDEKSKNLYLSETLGKKEKTHQWQLKWWPKTPKILKYKLIYLHSTLIYLNFNIYIFQYKTLTISTYT